MADLSLQIFLSRCCRLLSYPLPLISLATLSSREPARGARGLLRRRRHHHCVGARATGRRRRCGQPAGAGSGSGRGAQARGSRAARARQRPRRHRASSNPRVSGAMAKPSGGGGLLDLEGQYAFLLDRRAGALAALLCFLCWAASGALTSRLGFSVGWKVGIVTYFADKGDEGHPALPREDRPGRELHMDLLDFQYCYELHACYDWYA